VNIGGFAGILGYDFLKEAADGGTVSFDAKRGQLRVNEKEDDIVSACATWRDLPFNGRSYPVMDCGVYAMESCEGATALVDTAAPVTICNEALRDQAQLFPDFSAPDRTTTGVDGVQVPLVGAFAAGIRVGDKTKNVEFSMVPIAVADTPAMAALGFRKKPFILLGLDLLGDSFTFDFQHNELRFYSKSS